MPLSKANLKIEQVPKPCVICGKMFRRHKLTSVAKYCSSNCCWEAKYRVARAKRRAKQQVA